jgi:hypothetical protein
MAYKDLRGVLMVKGVKHRIPPLYIRNGFGFWSQRRRYWKDAYTKKSGIKVKGHWCGR